jgi:hypothetical protein
MFENDASAATPLALDALAWDLLNVKRVAVPGRARTSAWDGIRGRESAAKRREPLRRGVSFRCGSPLIGAPYEGPVSTTGERLHEHPDRVFV